MFRVILVDTDYLFVRGKLRTVLGILFGAGIDCKREFILDYIVDLKCGESIKIRKAAGNVDLSAKF